MPILGEIRVYLHSTRIWAEVIVGGWECHMHPDQLATQKSPSLGSGVHEECWDFRRTHWDLVLTQAVDSGMLPTQSVK